MIKKLILGFVFILLILAELVYIQQRLSGKLQALEEAQRTQSRQLFRLEGEAQQTIRKVLYLRYRHKQQRLQNNDLPGIYLASN